MPRRIKTNIKSLQECCVDNIVNNIEVWCYQYVTKYGSPNKLDHLDVDGPFDSLPSTFLERIIELLHRKNLLKRHHLEFLATPQLKTLNMIHCCLPFSKKDTVGISEFLHLTSVRCPVRKALVSLLFTFTILFAFDLEVYFSCFSLTILQQLAVLRWHNYYRKLSTFQMFLPMFHNLQELHISQTKIGDSCLQVLGAYCKELRVLNAEACSAVTDVGIKGLCATIFDETGMEIQTLGQCKSIHTLKMRNTRVTKKGIQLALENLPALRVFEFDFPLQILAESHEECNFSSYQLVSLSSADDYERSPCIPYKSGSLGRVASLSSSLNKVHIVTMPGLTDQELLGLLQLKSLCELVISTGEMNREITFDGGIVPILKAFGNSLTMFTLDEVYGLRVNIRAIVEYCPKLEFLKLEDTGEYITAPLDEERNSSKRMKKDLTLKNLKVLELGCDSDGDCDISAEGLDMLLSSPALVNLSLDPCVTVDDRIIRKAFDLHQFRNLQSLRVSHCHAVTGQAIYMLMNENNCLTKIEIDGCELLTKDFAEELVIFASQNSWDVDITHYEL